jgi:hypothetical protein
MSDKRIVTGVVIGVAVVAAVCIILYLQNENKMLAEENNELKEPAPLKKPIIINLDSVPKKIRKDFSEIVTHTHIDKSKQSFKEAYNHILHLKDHIENRGGYTLCYNDGKRITKEKHIHKLYDLSFYETPCDVNMEVNNGRGPVDFKISIGLDQTIVEFKLASNTHLKNILEQVGIYAKANHNANKLMVIVFFSEKEETKVNKLLKEFNLEDRKSIVLIDARNDNKASASTLRRTSQIDNNLVNNIREAKAV